MPFVLCRLSFSQTWQHGVPRRIESDGRCESMVTARTQACREALERFHQTKLRGPELP